jgi:hypothetical protein
MSTDIAPNAVLDREDKVDLTQEPELTPELKAEIFKSGESAGHTDWFEGRIRGGYKFGFERNNDLKIHNGNLNFEALQFVKDNETGLLDSDPSAIAGLINVAKLETKEGDEDWNLKVKEYNDDLESKLSWQFHEKDRDKMQAWINVILGPKSDDPDKPRKGFINNNENWGNAAVQLYGLFNNNLKGLEQYVIETENFLDAKTIGEKMEVFKSSENGLLMKTLLDRYRFWGDRKYNSKTSQRSMYVSDDIVSKLPEQSNISGLSLILTSDPENNDPRRIYSEMVSMYDDGLKKFRLALEESTQINEAIDNVRSKIESGDNPPIIEFGFMYEITRILEEYIEVNPNASNIAQAKQAYNNLLNYSINLDANLGVIEVVKKFIGTRN